MPHQDTATLPIRDFVLAVGTIESDRFILEGTAFFIGSRGFLVTAAHVAEAMQRRGEPSAILVIDNRFQAVRIVGVEVHPTEDIAVLQMPTAGPWYSIFAISRSSETSAMEVMMWGYPERVAHQIRNRTTDPNMAEFGVDPDLIYLQGYIRRPLNRSMPTGNLRGSAFYEINEVGGSCYSGSPVIPRMPGRTSDVIGIYVGEETADRRDLTGLVVRSDAVADWQPALIGNPIGDEMATHT